jgi:hypothetical protein
MPGHSSFLPEDYLARKMARRSNFVCLILFALVLTGVLGTYFVKYNQQREAIKLHGDAYAKVEEKAREIDQYTELNARRKEITLKAAVTSSLRDPIKKSNLMVELINHMPPSLSLLDMELDTNKLKTAPRPTTALQKRQANTKDKKKQEDAVPEIEITPTEVIIKLTGLAPTDVEVSEYMKALSNHILFRNVHLQYAEAYKFEDAEMRRFLIELKLQEGVTMSDLEPTRWDPNAAAKAMGGKMVLTPQIDEKKD